MTARRWVGATLVAVTAMVQAGCSSGPDEKAYLEEMREELPPIVGDRYSDQQLLELGRAFCAELRPTDPHYMRVNDAMRAELPRNDWEMVTANGRMIEDTLCPDKREGS